MKKLIFVLIALIILFSSISAEAKSTFLINDQLVNVDSEIIKGITMIPARLINSYFKEAIKWDQNTKELTVLGRAYNLKIKVAKKVAVINNKPLPLDIAPRIINNQLFIPARLLTQLYGGQLTWSAANKAINYQLYQLQSLEVKQQATKSELILRTNHLLDYNYDNYKEPERLVIDLKNSDLGAVKERIIVDNKLIDKIRTSQFSVNPAVVRVVIDLKEDVYYKFKDLKQGVKIELFKESAPVVASSIVSRKRNTDISQVNSEKRVPKFKFNSHKIVIDAGHGGNDPGAIGVTGLKEKDVNLEMAIQLQRKLMELGYNTILTRRDDHFISLSKRAQQANLRNADLFISIHANSNPKSWVNGTATYAHWYASKENWAVAWYIQSEMIKRIDLVDNGLKAANFAVLRETNMPAVLVETAFLSNQREEKLLNSISFQNKVTAGIVAGVERYFKEN